MKKLIAALLSLSIIIGVTIMSHAADIYGDLDKNGVVNSSDALLILQYSVGIKKSIDTKLADINHDSKINSTDALLALQISIGLIKPETVTSSTTTEPLKPPIKPNDKLIALTFDDGPYSPVTDRILDVLEKNGAVATFFVVGDRVDNNKNYRTSLKRAYDMGCEIGSHTYTHLILNSSVSAKTVNDEMSKSINAIKNVTGQNVTIMRPPGGVCNSNVKLPQIMWSVDTLDWKNRDATMNYNNAVNNAFDGCIILMHDLYPATADAVERIVPDLIAKGYKLVTVSQLMEARGIEMKSGGIYEQAKPKS